MYYVVFLYICKELLLIYIFSSYLVWAILWWYDTYGWIQYEKGDERKCYNQGKYLIIILLVNIYVKTNYYICYCDQVCVSKKYLIKLFSLSQSEIWLYVKEEFQWQISHNLKKSEYMRQFKTFFPSSIYFAAL